MMFRRSRRRLGGLPILLGIGALCAATGAPTASAAGPVTSCGDDTQLSSRLAAGGTVTFACGTRTIVLSGQKTIATDTVIDGGGRITLSGGNATNLFHVAGPAKLTLRNVVLTRGFSPTDAGVIYTDPGSQLVLDRATISHSTAQAGSGGAIFSKGRTTIIRSVLHHNTAANGGAIIGYWEDGDVVIRDSVLHHNRAVRTTSDGLGGVVYLHDGADLTITRSKLADNQAHRGGVLFDGYVNSTARITDSYLHHNEGSYDGGAITDFFGGALTVERSTFAANTALGAVYGGGAIMAYKTEIALTDVTLSGNTSQKPGGAISSGLGAATLTNVSLVDNTSATTNVAFYAFGATSTKMRNVLLSNPGANCSLDPAPEENVFNLSSDGSCSFGAGRDHVAFALGSLDTNGGRTPTHRSLPGSRGIDDGASSGCPAVDQRGVTRPRGASCDVGAVELVPCGRRPPAPVLLAPAASARTSGSKVALDWAGPDCARTFSVTVRRGSSSGPIAFASANLVASMAITSALPRGRSYAWRATACTRAGCRSSGWRTFRVP